MLFPYSSAKPPIARAPKSAHTPPSIFPAADGVFEAAGAEVLASVDADPVVDEVLPELVVLPFVPVPLALENSPVYGETR